MTVDYAEPTSGFDVHYATARLDAMRYQAMARDKRQQDVLAIRRGDYAAVAGEILPEDFDKAFVANLIDTAAHDISEVMAPLPSINCESSSTTSDTGKKFANKRSLIANHYVQSSRLGNQMFNAADKYMSFGYFAYLVEPNFETKNPVIRVSKSLTSYFSTDYLDRVVQYVETMRVPASELCNLYPEYTDVIRTHVSNRSNEDVVVAEWHDKHNIAVFLPEIKLELSCIPNLLGRPGVVIVGRPNLDDEKRGQFDDVIGVQVARAILAQYTLSAVQQSIEAPIAVPDDVTEMDLGPYSVMRSKNPDKIGRVPLSVPSGVFPEQQTLAQEQRVGSRYPEARSGNVDASIVTGQGVQALMGTFDTQIQTFQRLNETDLEDALSMAFEWDELLWPNRVKSVRVKDTGSPVEMTYKPSKDIAGDYSCDVSYGAIAGLDPNRALVFILQTISGGLISRETGRRHLPVDLDDVAESKRMDLEAIRDAELAAIAALAQAIPQMAANGQDPREIVQQIASVIQAREKGKSIDVAVTEVFAPKKTAEEAPPNPDMAALMAAQAGAGGAPPGGPQVAPPASPGQDLLMSLSGITPSGNANLQSNVSRMELAR